MKETKLTGYPSVDKPWLKYYTQETLETKIPDVSMYSLLYENNKKD